MVTQASSGWLKVEARNLSELVKPPDFGGLEMRAEARDQFGCRDHAKVIVQRYDVARAAFDGEVTRLLTLPATILRGFACKARILMWFHNDADDAARMIDQLPEFAPQPVKDRRGI